MLKKAAFSFAAAATAVTMGLVSTAKVSQASEDLVFSLSNASTYEIMEFYASPSGLSDWENDILGDRTLMPNESISINVNDGRAVCEYDLLTVLGDGSEVERYDVNLCDLQGGSYTITEG